MVNQIRFAFSVIILLLSVATLTVHAQTDHADNSLGKDLSIEHQSDATTVLTGDNVPSGTYEIADISVSGYEYLDDKIILTIFGLSVGETIRLPNDESIASGIRALWQQGMFSDVQVVVTKITGNRIFLSLRIVERPRLSGYEITGVAKGQQSELKDKLKQILVVNRMVTESLKKDVTQKVTTFYSDKGFSNVAVDILEKKNPETPNAVFINVKINKGGKVHINQINFSGNDNATNLRLKRTLKNTKEMGRLSLYPADDENVYGATHPSFKDYVRSKGFLSFSNTLEALDPYFRWNIFSGSKFNPVKYEGDKGTLISFYNSIGYRDAQVEKDTTYYVKNGNLNIDMKLREGKKYYFGDIQWKGNTKYSDSLLTRILGIKKGDVYDGELLASRLAGNEGGDITGLYMDDGYLFFKVDPIEKSIVNDTINYEIVITEGPQATVDKITISGNTRTNDHVLRRELFTLPGNKFSRSDVIRSIRQISNLGFIDPEKVNPNFIPNLSKGTVDIDYNVAEKSSDQLELSAGYGGGIGFTGSLGVVFNNFSLRNLFKLKEWSPLPMGDGQKLSIRYQSSGLWYNSINFAFTEPWLGGKKPTALTVSGVYGRYAQNIGDANPNSSYLRNIGGGVSISKRLRWPDDNFIFSYGINYQNYFLNNYTLFSDFKDGFSNNLSLRLSISRSTVDQPIFPRSGSNINFTFMLTPPYSMFSDKNYSSLTAQEKFNWIEYHKYRFTAEWYQKIAGNLVLKLSMKYGFLGYYNKQLGFSPFERFQVGGDGLSGFNYFVGRDIISLRGYEILTNATDATIFNKYTAEVRYPFSLNPSATIFGLAFVEAGNGWNNIKEYNPMQLYRSAGLGVRIFLPMFGLLGLDYGLGFDRLGPGVKFGSAFKFTFMLGQEPD